MTSYILKIQCKNLLYFICVIYILEDIIKISKPQNRICFQKLSSKHYFLSKLNPHLMIQIYYSSTLIQIMTIKYPDNNICNQQDQFFKDTLRKIHENFYDYQYKLYIQYKINHMTTKISNFKSYHKILDNLYLGNQDAAKDHFTFFNQEIKAVCVCGNYLQSPFQHRYQYKKHDIFDLPTTQVLSLFQPTYEWIKKKHQQGKNVLLHCSFGVSRSATFVLAFLMRDKGIDFEQAYKFVKERRSIINPNDGFVKQLKIYEKQLVQRNIIKKINNSQKIQQSKVENNMNIKFKQNRKSKFKK